MSHGGVGRLVQLLTQDLQLGKALDKDRKEEDTGLISGQHAATLLISPNYRARTER